METINILCATDNNYAPYCGIMLTSLFESNKDCHFVVYVFEDGSVTDENIQKYRCLAKKYGNEIVLKTIDESMVKGFPINENAHITVPTYYRLFAADLLPKDVHKVIYLDCDVIVVGDIRPLWNVNLKDLAFAGIMDCTPLLDQSCNRLGYASSYSYINAGVLVYNLDCWRENGLVEKISGYIYENDANLIYMDQDALNGVLFDKKKMLPEQYNFSTEFFERNHWESYLKERQHHYMDECINAVIIHYQGRIKPWNIRNYRGPFFYKWDKYRKKSLWRSCVRIVPWHKHFADRVKRCIYSIFYRYRNAQWIVLRKNRFCYKECII